MLLLEGVERIIVTTDDPHRHPPGRSPRTSTCATAAASTKHSELAEVPGVTVLLHDQGCAAENRRAGRSGTIAKPGFRVVINERVCEGCGDCGDKSNCLSVQPVETPYGRKTRIHQTSCNFDLSCLQGDCPSFATVTVDDGRRPKAAGRSGSTPRPIVPAPLGALVDPDDVTVRLSGIGGTGVITVSQVLGTAAMLDGLDVRGLDQTGLSQKAGPVVSDLRLTRDEHGRVEPCERVRGRLSARLRPARRRQRHQPRRRRPDRTVVVGSTDATPTGRW